jgi:hypothetical protein
MSAAIPSSEPTSIMAGDTIPWTKSLSDYPASAGWALSYAFRLQQGAGVLNVTASASGDNFAATITAAQSALMTAGIWIWSSYVTKTTERYHISSGTLTVSPNLAAIDYAIDLRSSAKKALDNALAMWEAVKLGQTVMLNGRTYTQHNLKDLILFVNQCKSDYAKEVQAEKFETTGINTRRIGVRLTRV